MWHAPLGRAPQGLDLVLLGLGFRACFVFFKGRGQGGRVGESWAAQTLLLLRVGVVLGASPDWVTLGAQFSI